MKIMINNREFTPTELELWKLKRIKKVYKTLGIKLPDNKTINELNESLTQFKFNLSYKELISRLKVKLFLGRFMMKLAKLFSGTRRRSAITTIYAENISVEKFSSKLDDLMLNNTDENKKVNLSVCPDHYVLTPKDGILEVIETTGNTPVPTQFFITFDDETGIKEPRNLNYTHQSTGVAKLKDGTIMGGVRHQFKNSDTGMEARFVVEFPAICPRWIIKEHEKHLAVEWSNWIEWIKTN